MTTGASVRVSVRGLKELRGQIIALETMVQGGELGQVESDNLDYNRYVQSEEEQAGIHRGRWLTEEGAVREHHRTVEKIYQAFFDEQLAKDKPDGSLREPTAKAVVYLLDVMQHYPPPPMGSTYKRTGNLRSSWQPDVFL
jgi:hypothetical protein